MRVQHKIAVGQTATGYDTNNALLRENGTLILDSNGWYHLSNNTNRFDVLLTASSVTSGFTVQLYTKTIDGDEHPYGDPIVFGSNGTDGYFQAPVTANAIKLKITAYTDGSLDAEVHSS